MPVEPFKLTATTAASATAATLASAASTATTAATALFAICVCAFGWYHKIDGYAGRSLTPPVSGCFIALFASSTIARGRITATSLVVTSASRAAAPAATAAILACGGGSSLCRLLLLRRWRLFTSFVAFKKKKKHSRSARTIYILWIPSASRWRRRSRRGDIPRRANIFAEATDILCGAYVTAHASAGMRSARATTA